MERYPVALARLKEEAKKCRREEARATTAEERARAKQALEAAEYRLFITVAARKSIKPWEWSVVKDKDGKHPIQSVTATAHDAEWYAVAFTIDGETIIAVDWGSIQRVEV